MKKIIFLSLLCFSVVSFAGESWKNDKYLWEKLFDNKENIKFIIGGDINGDMKDDIVVVYNSDEDNKIAAAVTVGKEYKKVEMDRETFKYIGTDRFNEINAVEIKSGKIYINTTLDLNLFVTDMKGESKAMVVLDYSKARLNISNVSGNGILCGTEEKAQYNYDVKEGYIYYNNLKEPQKIGVATSYYYKQYSRVIVPKTSGIDINCDEDKWVLKSNENKIDSSWKHLEITYGFEKWKNDFDLSAKYYTAHDEDNFYVFIRVTDDIFRQNMSGDKGLRGDHVELWFGDNNSNKYQLALLPGNFGNIKAEVIQWYYKNKPISNKKISGAEIKSKKTDNGYIIEAKIPFSEFGESDLSNLTKFTLSVSDSDDADKQEKLMSSSSLIWGEDWSIGEIIWE